MLKKSATGITANYGKFQFVGKLACQSVGKFISEDPLGFGGLDTNLSRYVGNGAINYTDASGLQRRPVNGNPPPLNLNDRPDIQAMMTRMEVAGQNDSSGSFRPDDVIKPPVTLNPFTWPLIRTLPWKLGGYTYTPPNDISISNLVDSNGLPNKVTTASGLGTHHGQTINQAGKSAASLTTQMVQSTSGHVAGGIVFNGLPPMKPGGMRSVTLGKGPAAFSHVPKNFRPKVIKSFKGGNATALKLTDDLIVYRYSGGNAPITGSPWFTPTRYKNSGNAQRYLALNPANNSATTVTAFRIRAGTTILKGKAATQTKIYGSTATGGGIQYYLPDPLNAIPLD